MRLLAASLKPLAPGNAIALSRSAILVSKIVSDRAFSFVRGSILTVAFSLGTTTGRPDDRDDVASFAERSARMRVGDAGQAVPWIVTDISCDLGG